MHYRLEKYRNRSSRHTCPACHDRHSFTRYICVETGKYIHDSVGRCDHESSCGYHYSPSQFYRDNPWESRDSTSYKPLSVRKSERQVHQPDPVYLPDEYVSQRMSADSPFAHWLVSVVGEERASHAVTTFRLGSTASGKFRSPAVIFWQIDRFNRVHDGKLMWYRPDGHRERYMTWVSSRLKASGLYPDQDTVKCLFGEHQLASCNSSPPIVLVESEKSAIVGSCLFPCFVWMASCGCGGLNRDKLRPLIGHKVLVFPDAGEYSKWDDILSTSGIDYTITSMLEAYPPNTDLVDILIDGVQPVNGDAADITSFLTL